MKTWKDFLSFTNIRERIASLLIMLMLLSILYCSIYSMGISVVSRAGSMLVSYLFLYLIVVVAAYVYLIVMFQFIRTKREDIRTLTMKDYMFPHWGADPAVCRNGGEQLAFLSADACGYEQYQYHTDSNHACADDVLYSGAGICLLCHL